MSERFNMYKVQPEAYRAMSALDKYIGTTGIDPLQREFIKIRASQINGCAFCVNHHTRDARKLGATEQQIYLLSVWPEAGNIFTDEEKCMMAMTEEVTLISEKGLSMATYDRAITLFGEEKTAWILMVIITINAWNRIGVSLSMHPEP